MHPLILVCLKHAPVHGNIMLAYRAAYLRRCPGAPCVWIAPPEFESLIPEGAVWFRCGSSQQVAGGLWQVLRSARRVTAADLGLATALPALSHVFVQSTHPANAVLVRRLRRLLGTVVAHSYLHEPGGFVLKLCRGDGWVLSTAVTLTHCMDLLACDRFYVSSAAARQRALHSYPLTGLARRCDLLPLPFTDLVPDWQTPAPVGAPHLLMLGRADNRRCLDVFLRAAELAAASHPAWRFSVLSSSQNDLGPQFRRLPNLSLQLGAPYSDAQMSAALSQASHVFNLFRISYTQSGVSPVALMHGVPVIAQAWERDLALEAMGCIYFDRIPDAMALLRAVAAAPPASPAALRAHYLDTFDADRVVLPEAAVT